MKAPSRVPLQTLWLLVCAVAPTAAPKAWTWRGGEHLSLAAQGVYRPCNGQQARVWRHCLLTHGTAAACTGELQLVDCDTFVGIAWPGGREGHALVYDGSSQGAWLFGGLGVGSATAGECACACASEGCV